MFRDHRTAGSWLPKTMYTTRFQENGYHSLAEFDNDVDLTTGSGAGRRRSPAITCRPGTRTRLNFRGAGNDPQGHNAVWIGWNNRAGEDLPTTKTRRPVSDRRRVEADAEVQTPTATPSSDQTPLTKRRN